MALAFQGFHQHVLSFEGDVEVGDLVSLDTNGEVAKASADSDFIGICVSKRGRLVGIQVYGTAELSYTGTVPSYGYTGLAAAGDNAVKHSAAGRKLLVAGSDSSKNTVTVIL